MKKFFITAIAVVLVAAFAIPAMAVDISGEIKVKGEWRQNADFSDGDPDQNYAYIAQRTRLTATANPTDSTTVKITIQDTKLWGGDDQLTNRGSNTLDLHEAYIQEDNFFGSDLSLRIGRQVLSYDDQRLIGGFNWSMNARAFEAIKAMYGSDDFDVDLFAAKLVEGFEASSNEDDLYGVHATIKTIPNNSLSVYAFIQRLRDDSFGAGTTKRNTFGARIKGSNSGIDYNGEVIFQTGTSGVDDVMDLSAYAIVVRGGYSLGGPNNVRIGGEFNYGTGDDDPTDTENNTFTNLYPTNHAHYGSMDSHSLSNSLAYNVNVSAMATPDVKVIGSYWIFNRNETRDGAYMANAPALDTSVTATEEGIASELDITAIYKYNKALTIKGGYSHYFVGDAIEENDPLSEDADWAWLLAVAKF